MTTKWTPGPWRYYEELGASFSAVSGADVVVAGVPNEDDPQEREIQRANARLIAAAPALYEALAAIADAVRPLSYASRFRDLVNIADAALRSARGDADDAKEGGR